MGGRGGTGSGRLAVGAADSHVSHDAVSVGSTETPPRSPRAAGTRHPANARWSLCARHAERGSVFVGGRNSTGVVLFARRPLSLCYSAQVSLFHLTFNSSTILAVLF